MLCDRRDYMESKFKEIELDWQVFGVSSSATQKLCWKLQITDDYILFSVSLMIVVTRSLIKPGLNSRIRSGGRDGRYEYDG